MTEPDPKRKPATSSVSIEAGNPVLYLAGDLDLSSIQQVRGSANELIQQQPNRLMIDVTDLTFMDSSGIALLLWIANRVPRVELRNPSPNIQQLLYITGLTDTLPIAQ